MLKFYGYDKCSTCKNAEKFLTVQKINFEKTDITQTAPAISTLKLALNQGYTLMDLFNKSGVQYRELGMKDKVKTMTESEALKLLSQNGRLVKRPIVTDGKNITVGFKEASFKKLWR